MSGKVVRPANFQAKLDVDRAANLSVKLYNALAGEDSDGIILMAFVGALILWIDHSEVSAKRVLDEINAAFRRGT